VIPVRWEPRADPLAIRGVWARGPAAEALIARLRADPERVFRGLGGADWVLLLGEEPPWVDDLVYLGRDPAAPRLLLPTHLAPYAGTVQAAAMLDRRVTAQCQGHAGPYAIVPEFGVIPVGAARTVEPEGWPP
jgi:MoxR-vWA-beta-propeller ternary system domain bpX5